VGVGVGGCGSRSRRLAASGGSQRAASRRICIHMHMVGSGLCAGRLPWLPSTCRLPAVYYLPSTTCRLPAVYLPCLPAVYYLPSTCRLPAVYLPWLAIRVSSLEEADLPQCKRRAAHRKRNLSII